MKKIIYLDNAATTRVYPKVAEEMQKFLSENFGNPSSIHAFGDRAADAIRIAREKIAKEIGAKPWEIVFTSGGTEANNLVINGLTLANPNKKKIIISSIEHPSMSELCKFLKNWGYKIVEISVDKEGIVDLKKLEKEIDDETLLVSIMHVNNEIGTVQDIKKIGDICRQKKVYFHTDAVQSFAKMKIDVKDMNIDMLSASGHKIGGPKGIGFLYIREGINIKPIMIGGGQERGFRSGTENVAGIAGFAKALDITKKIDKGKIIKLRYKLIFELEKIGGKINGSKINRIYNNVSVSFPGIEGDTAVIYLSERGIMCSTGSACKSKQLKESHVLAALGLNKKEIAGSLRLTLNEYVSEKDIDYAVAEINKVVKKLTI